MELLCVEQYNDINFTLTPGDTTERVPHLTEDFKKSLLNDYPQKFKVIKSTKESELVIEAKEDKMVRKITKK